MKYKNPQTVASPQDLIKNVQVIFDGGDGLNGTQGYSIAILEDHEGKFSIGMRWNVSHRECDDTDKSNNVTECVGNPQSRGYSTWFILPKDDIFLTNINNALKKLNEKR